jgi:hypothetical protein
MVRAAAFLQWRILKKDDYVIELVEKIEYKRKENVYLMKVNGMNLWINGYKNGGPAKYTYHSCNSNSELVQWQVDSLPHSASLPRRI